MIKKDYMKPSVHVVQMQHTTMLLSGSDKAYDAIGQGTDNAPPGVRFFGDFDDWDDWE